MSIENAAWWASDILRLQDVRCCCGLARVFSGRYVRESVVDVPWGWRWLKVPDLDAKVLLPLWLYWPVRLWSDRYHLIFRPLLGLGLWRVREPAGYYVDGHLTAPRWLRRAFWCFINDTDRAPKRVAFVSPVQRHAFDVWADAMLSRYAWAHWETRVPAEARERITREVLGRPRWTGHVEAGAPGDLTDFLTNEARAWTK